MTDRSLTALFCGAILVPLVIAGWMVHRKLHPPPAVDTTYAAIDVVVRQPSYYRRLDSIARDSARRDSIARRR